MKKIYIILILIAVGVGGFFSASAQNDSTKIIKYDSLTWSMPKAKDFRRWEAGLHIGMGFPTTDISASDFNSSYAKENLMLGLKGARFFSHTFGLQLEYIYGHLQGQNRAIDTYDYTTTVYYDATINALFHIGNIRFLSRTPRIAIYGAIGVGLIHFTPKNDSAGIAVGHNYFVNKFAGITQYLPADYSNSTEYIIPFTAGIRYLVSDKVSINLEYSLRATRTDKLDGFWVALSEDDNYTYASIGVTYHFGKQKQIIEWVNPVDALYDSFYAQLNNLKKSIDSLKKDTDGDGVSDYFDVDNATPKGYMVYGNGKAVDFDQDGVPDAEDFCPTVPGPASNHGCPEAKVEQIETKKAPEPEVLKTPISNEEEKIVAEVIKNLQFETGKSIIRESSYISLNELASVLKKKPSYKLLIEGHTDNVGGAAANMKLSTDRAESVKKYFIDKGIDPSRLTAKGWGLTKPIADNKTPEGRQQNRRVDFTITQ